MSADEQIRVRRIRAEDGAILRDLRLRSIADSPDAFGQPLGEARRRPEAEWQRNARRSSHGYSRTWLIVDSPAGTVGIVQGRRRLPSTLLLFSMWVDPTARGTGVGRILIEALEAWAGSWAGSETILWVLGANNKAIEFYRHLGFELVRSGPDAESGARFGAMAMRRPIVDRPKDDRLGPC